jgi:hypothetical protein
LYLYCAEAAAERVDPPLLWQALGDSSVVHAPEQRLRESRPRYWAVLDGTPGLCCNLTCAGIYAKQRSHFGLRRLAMQVFCCLVHQTIAFS